MSAATAEASSLSEEELKEKLKTDNKNSRMNAALGADTTAKLMKLKCLLVGIRGVGVETAKNLALQGTGCISVYDPSLCEMKDSGVNFFINAQDVAEGKKRADAVLPRLKELNPTCNMQVVEDLSDATVLAHDALIITRFTPLTELKRLDELCRNNKKSFYYCYTGGVNSCIFVDHGDAHFVVDFNGVRPIQKLIVDITPIEGKDECLVRYETPEGQLPNAIHDGDFQIDEVVGGCADALNQKTFAVEHQWKDPVKTVRVPVNIASMGAYEIGGILLEKKLPKHYPMKSLAEKITTPGELISTDLAAFTELQQHLAFVATSTYAERVGALPRVGSAEDAAAVVAISKELLASKAVDLEVEPDEALITKYALYASVELQPMAAFLGGVLAQEVVKCQLEVLVPTRDGVESKIYFGKFTPIPGFMHFASPESLPDTTPSDTAARNDRNDELAAIYGWSFVEKLGNLKYFMVGCGALGCEFMKNFALNGICCGPEGMLTVTDNDRIELSNLTRQFLFREHNVGQPKSRAAGAMATVMNPGFKVRSLELFVGAISENTFNDAFWMNLNGVCNALDNMEARHYVDGQCVKYERSLLESGTMGTDGNVDTICPFKTRTYGEGGKADEKGDIPMCTLRNFPHLTDHCIEWARDQFGALFVKLGKNAEAYMADSAAFESKIRESAESTFAEISALASFMRVVKTPTIEMAAQLAFDLFHFLFRDRILDLQAAFPIDARSIVDGEDKGAFWGEKKRYPSSFTYNGADPSHTNFMIATTCLFATNLGIVEQKIESQEDDWCKPYRSVDWINSIVATLTPPTYIQAPVSVDGVKKSEEEMARENEYKEAQVERLLGELREVATPFSKPVEPASFEKDDDYNFHIEFVAAAANLRCDNYKLKRTEFAACKVIAGKIIAAIATTTAACCGLVMLELFKLALDKPTDSLMNRNIGLGVNQYTTFSQEPPRKHKTYTKRTEPGPTEAPAEAFDAQGKIVEEYVKKEVMRAYPEDHSVWDKIVIPGDLTMKQFAEWLAVEHSLKITAWDFVLGTKKTKDDEGKDLLTNVTSPVYPPPLVFDYSLLPSLELTKAQAVGQLPKGNLQMKYLALWSKCKEDGAIPPQPVSSTLVLESTTLRQMLEIMAVRAEEAVKAGEVDKGHKSISDVSDRQFWVILGKDCPLMEHTESGESIESCASFKIML